MQMISPSILTFVGAVMMAGFGSYIARQIGVEQWQFAGFAAGLILCAIAPTWEMRRRLKILEAEIDKANREGGRHL